MTSVAQVGLPPVDDDALLLEALLLTIGAGDHFRTKIGHRVPAMNVGLTAIDAVNRLVNQAENGRMGLAEARAGLDAAWLSRSSRTAG